MSLEKKLLTSITKEINSRFGLEAEAKHIDWAFGAQSWVLYGDTGVVGSQHVEIAIIELNVKVILKERVPPRDRDQIIDRAIFNLNDPDSLDKIMDAFEEFYSSAKKYRSRRHNPEISSQRVKDQIQD